MIAPADPRPGRVKVALLVLTAVLLAPVLLAIFFVNLIGERR